MSKESKIAKLNNTIELQYNKLGKLLQVEGEISSFGAISNEISTLAPVDDINITNKKNELVEKARSLNNTYVSHISNLRYEYKSNINNLEDDLERLRYED